MNFSGFEVNLVDFVEFWCFIVFGNMMELPSVKNDVKIYVECDSEW